MTSVEISSPSQLDVDNNYKFFLPSIRARVLSSNKGVKIYKCFGGAKLQEDINIYGFYQYHGPKMSALHIIITQILGQPEASHTPEKIFSRGGHVLNRYRTSLMSFVSITLTFFPQCNILRPVPPNL